MAFLTDDISINTILGDGSFISNEVKITGNLRVEGDVDGNIESTGSIFVGEKARIRGNVTASSAEILGIVIGDVVAPKSVLIHSSAAVIGDIFTKRIQIDKKAIFNGHCIAKKDSEEYEKLKRDYETEKSVLENKITSENLHGGR